MKQFEERNIKYGQTGRSTLRSPKFPNGQIGAHAPPQIAAHDLDTGITVSRAAARALRALSRRFRGRFASPAPLGVHRPTRASGDGAEGVERIEGARRRRKTCRQSPLTRARPRVPANTRLPYLERRARASEPPPRDGRARSVVRRRRRPARALRRDRVAAGRVNHELARGHLYASDHHRRAR